MQALVSTQHREAYDEMSLPIKVKNKFINFLFENRELEEVTFIKTIICFFAIFLIFLGLGIFLYVEVASVKELKFQYYSPQSSSCDIHDTCTFDIVIEDDMQAPVYLMYYLGNFYQNVRRYVQSKSNYQLAGNQITVPEAFVCFPYITNSDMGKTKSWGGSVLNSSAAASPCGSIAYSFPYFNDAYQLFTSNGTQIYIDETGISWNGDKAQVFAKEPSSKQTQWIDVENQHFIVWMRTSGLPNFRKPWGKIDQTLPKGKYVLRVSNQLNITGWGGNRGIILTTSSLVGGRNFLLPTSFLIIAILCCVAAVFFCIRFRSLRDLGKLKQ